MEWLSNDLLVSSHTDHGAAVWQAQRVRLQRRLPDTACQLAVAGTQLVTIQSNNKLRIYDRGEQCRVETKLRSGKNLIYTCRIKTATITAEGIFHDRTV